MKDKIVNLYKKSSTEDIATGEFAEQVLRLFINNDWLPVGYVSTKNELPENGEEVIVVTDKDKIASLYAKSRTENINTDEFAEQVLRLFINNDWLPVVGYVSTKNELPENGEEVIVVTDKGRVSYARFERFLGNTLWETRYESKQDETVVGWKRISK